MAADGTPGAKGNPQFLGDGAPATATDQNLISQWAADNIDASVPTVPDLANLPNKWVGMRRLVLADNGEYIYLGTTSGWVRNGSLRLGVSRNNGVNVVAATPAWTDICTVTAPSFGGTCVADWATHFYNSNSGAARTVSMRVVCDGTQVDEICSYDVPLADTVGRPAAYNVESAPAPGTHTWKLQVNASVTPAIVVRHAVLTVTAY